MLSFENQRARERSAAAQLQVASTTTPGEPLTLVRGAAAEDDTRFAAPQYDALIAIPQDQLASAWLDLVPRLRIAGAIALIVSFIVSYFISRSISGPLRGSRRRRSRWRSGNYDVHIPITR